MSSIKSGGSSDDDDDEFSDNHRTNINLPKIDLSYVRQQNAKDSSPHPITKVGKNLIRKPSNKSLARSDSKSSIKAAAILELPRKLSSGTLGEVRDSIDLSNDYSLPTFRFDACEAGVRNRLFGAFDNDPADDFSDESDFDEPTHHPQGPQAFDTDSSDESDQNEDDDPVRLSQLTDSQLSNFKPPTERSISNVESNSSKSTRLSLRQSIGSRLFNFHKNIQEKNNPFANDEIKSSQASVTDSQSSFDKPESIDGHLKKIWKKLSLAEPSKIDEIYDKHDRNSAHSDGFIGKVLNYSTGTSGGLTPGASNRNSRAKPLDEEQVVGGALDSPDSIEMKKMNFSSYNKEAQSMILSHIPEAADFFKNPKNLDYLNDHSLPVLPILPTLPALANSTSFFIEKDNNSDQNQNDSVSSKNNSFDNNVRNMNLQNLDDSDEETKLPQFKAGVLSSILKLYQTQGQAFPQQQSRPLMDKLPAESSRTSINDNLSTLGPTSPTSPVDITKLNTTFNSNISDTSFSPNTNRESTSSAELEKEPTQEGLPSFLNAKPKLPPKKKLPKISSKIKSRKKEQARQLRITVHIADILQRQRFILRMCKALMKYGAPTHRLEEYMVMTSKVLEIDGQFIYFPGCMIVAFSDASTRTSEIHLVKCNQGVNLSKLADTHAIYKRVIHDLVSVEQAAGDLEELLRRKNRFNPWICVFLYGLGSASVSPFAFSGNWMDVPISFGLGLCIGYLQYIISSISNLYSSVFEVSASIVVSFVARAIGSIRGGELFCFGAIAQGSLALILPGYIILCGSLELQSRNLVAGSVRMFYAIIYSLFLGFGITLGSALYGWVDKDGTNQAKCSPGHNIDDKWRILFIPLFSVCLGLINQARFTQLPAMVFISCIGYLVNYFAGKHFNDVTEFSAAIGSFVIGILGNMYSRIGKGMAVSVMLPGIFLQVPSGIASQSTLLSGVNTANEITNSTSSGHHQESQITSLSFGASMVEVSIGITVGVFAAALVLYPFGKKRTGLFTL